MDSYAYFEHDADIGIEGFGQSPEQAFIGAARALFSIECDPEQIRPDRTVELEFVERDLELALVLWLNLLISKARAANLALCRFELRREGDRWIGEARGDAWQEKFERGVEVKGATLTMLSVTQRAGVWRAACVVDV